MFPPKKAGTHRFGVGIEVPVTRCSTCVSNARNGTCRDDNTAEISYLTREQVSKDLEAGAGNLHHNSDNSVYDPCHRQCQQQDNIDLYHTTSIVIIQHQQQRNNNQQPTTNNKQ